MPSTYKTRGSAAPQRGPSPLARGQVTEIQRGRMLAAAVDVVEEMGYARTTVAQIIGRARVSRKTFYDVFSDREDCFLAAFEQAFDEAHDLAREAFQSEAEWREGVRAALACLLNAMEEEPGLSRLCVVEALAGGERVLERRVAIYEQLAGVIDQGRAAAGGGVQLPEVTAEGIVGAVCAVLHSRVIEGGRGPLIELLGPLMSIIVLPYLGASAAAQELSRPIPEISKRLRGRSRRRTADPLAGLEMRLTYRTVRVLMVISDRPGASNREIAEGSGVADQGQISKLLNRLARLELVENLGGGQERGAANAWYLTARGSAVERATRPR